MCFACRCASDPDAWLQPCPTLGQCAVVLVQAGFTSLAHTDADIEHTIQAARETLAEI